MYYHLTMKLLYLYKRAHPDIQLPISFLTTRLRDPGQQDWLTLEDLSIKVIKLFIDTSFTLYGGVRRHTGSKINLVEGCVFGMSVHQKLNTKSLTNSELVVFSDILPQVIWTRYILEA